MVKNQITISLNNSRTSVTGMIMNVEKNKMITSGLDKTVSVWSVFRRNGVIILLFRMLRKLSMTKLFTSTNLSANYSHPYSVHK